MCTRYDEEDSFRLVWRDSSHCIIKSHTMQCRWGLSSNHTTIYALLKERKNGWMNAKNDKHCTFEAIKHKTALWSSSVYWKHEEQTNDGHATIAFPQLFCWNSCSSSSSPSTIQLHHNWEYSKPMSSRMHVIREKNNSLQTWLKPCSHCFALHAILNGTSTLTATNLT